MVKTGVTIGEYCESAAIGQRAGRVARSGKRFGLAYLDTSPGSAPNTPKGRFRMNTAR